MSSRITHPGVVVGVDGSASARKAVRWAAREAVMRNVPLTLVHALSATTVSSATSGWPAAPIPAELWPRQEDEARKIIADAAKVVEDSADDGAAAEVDTELLYSPPIPALIDFSKEAQLMVVGCRGRSALGRTLLGSVSTGLIHHAHCPVAVIHDAASGRPNDLPVVVGINGSRASELAAAIAFDEASWRGVDLVALLAWDDATTFAVTSQEWLDLQSGAEETLAERLAGFQERYPDVTVRPLVVWGRPAHHLLEQSESAQLVVVGSHGRGGFAGMLLGSVGMAVVQGARTPVIVARQQ